jgi:hypothetical protein
MYKTLFCLSAVALCFTAGAYAEDAQDSANDQSSEQLLAGCGCKKRTKKDSEGDKGNKDVVASCDCDENFEESIAPETALTCGACGGKGK